MRKIRVQAKISANRKTFDLKVIELTHIERNFAGGQLELAGHINGPYVFIHKNILLGAYIQAPCVTYALEAWGGPFSGTKYSVMFSCSRNYTDNGLNVVKNIPAEDWPLIKEAIKAYNEFYRDR